jgi:hypothetical protein
MLAFVEGSMERQFLNSNFKYVRVVPVKNGISWSKEQLARQIVSAYLAYDKPEEVVVWLDREGRTDSVEELRQYLISELTSAGSQLMQTHVLVNDQMSENIILADEDVIRDEFGDEAYVYRHEGLNGKSRLKDYFKTKDINYKEMINGAQMLKKIRLRNCARSSACVQSFLTTFDRECWWI